MERIKFNENIFEYPMPVTLLGVRIEGKENFMAVGWITRVNANPPMLAVSIGNHHYSIKGLEQNGEFSINYPSSDMMIVTDYCGIVSGSKDDKSGVFKTFTGELENAPMIEECTLNLECQIVENKKFDTNTLFIAKIIASYTRDKYLTDGKLDIKKMDPLLLTIPDNRYWKVGEYAGNAYRDGKKFKK